MEVGQHGNKLRIGAIIQARYDSTRLPGKVLMELPFLSGSSLLSRITMRLKKAQLIDEIIVATSDEDNDLPILQETKALDVNCYRGSKDNVLNRFCNAASLHNLDVIIRITGDNPLVLIDKLEEVLIAHLKGKYDYSRNNGLPYGTSFEIVNTKALDKIQSLKHTKEDQEHVTIFIKNNRELFSINEISHNVLSEKYKKLRLTVDYASDFALMNLIFTKLKSNNLLEDYLLSDILNIFKTDEWFFEVNSNNNQKKQFKTLNEEIEEVLEILKPLDVKRTKAALLDLKRK